MIDLIRDGQVFDVGYYYSHNEFISEFNSIGRNLAHEEGHNFSSYYAANEAKALAKISRAERAVQRVTLYTRLTLYTNDITYKNRKYFIGSIFI